MWEVDDKGGRSERKGTLEGGLREARGANGVQNFDKTSWRSGGNGKMLTWRDS